MGQAGRSYRDSRVRAAFAIAPALGPAFIPSSLRRITTPVAIVAGAEDRIAPVSWNAQLQLCADAAGVDRETIHRRVIDSAALFFGNTLK
jgi:pimeloyl-ACP methyl ester carboxylesterase